MGPRSRREESRRRTGDPITHCSHSGQIGSRTGGDAPFPTWRQVSQWSGGCRAPRSGALLPEGQGCLTRDFACLEHHCYRSLGVTALKILAAFASGFLIFPALCWFLPYGNVTQPSLHICPLAREPPSPLPIPFPLGHHRARAWRLALLTRSSWTPETYLTARCVYADAAVSTYPTPSLPRCVHRAFSTSASPLLPQIGSSEPFS